MFRRPELLVAASVPVLLLAGVLSWHRDLVCTRSGCGTVTASAWTGSPVWAVVLVVALALGGVWVLLPPTRGEVPLGLAALTGVAGVVSAGIVLVSLDALVFNHAAFFGFDLPVTETFPVLAVHPGPGLLLGLLGLLLQAAGGWTSVRHRTALLTPPRRQRNSADPWPTAVPPPADSWPAGTPSPATPRPAATAAAPWPVRTPSPANPRPAAGADHWSAATPAAADPWPAATPAAADHWSAATPVAAAPWPVRTPSPANPRPAAGADHWSAATPPAAYPWPAATSPAGPPGAGASPAPPHGPGQPPAAAPLGPARAAPVPPSARQPQPEAREAVRDRQPGGAQERGWEAVAFGQGAPPTRRHRRRAE